MPINTTHCSIRFKTGFSSANDWTIPPADLFGDGRSGPDTITPYKWIGANAKGYDPEEQNAWGTLPMKRADILDPDNEFRGKAPKVRPSTNPARPSSIHSILRFPLVSILFQFLDQLPTQASFTPSLRRCLFSGSTDSLLNSSLLKPSLASSHLSPHTIPLIQPSSPRTISSPARGRISPRAATRPAPARRSSTPGPSSSPQRRCS